MLIDPNAIVFAFALLFGGLALLAVFVLVIGERIFSKKSETYLAKVLVRCVAAYIDVSFVCFIFDIVWSGIDPAYISPILLALTYAPYTPVTAILTLIMGFAISAISFLTLEILLFGVFDFWRPMLLVVVVGFSYFFTFEAYFGGKTPGRLVLGLETMHESMSRSLSLKEASINAIGKCFLLLDLILGYFVYVFNSRSEELGQIRLTQQLAGAVTKDSYYKKPLTREKSDSFLIDDGSSGVKWWDDNDDEL
ncbi:MAG: hypothetical protein ACFFES_04355 [Candidatus Thorarchaeota archaeon]